MPEITPFINHFPYIGIFALLILAFMGGIGYWGGNSVQILKKDLTRIEHIAIVAIMILITGWIFFKYFKGTKKFEEGKNGDKIES